jgi:AraC family transcriptional regulator
MRKGGVIMTDAQWRHLTPVLQHHIYWHRKEQFLLATDCYPHWTLFAVEEGRFDYDIGGERGTGRFSELVLCPPDIPFGRTVTETLSFHFLAFHFVKPGGEQVSVLPGKDEALCKLSIADTKRLATTYSQLRNTARSGGASAMEWAGHLLKDLWRQYAYEQSAAPDVMHEELPLGQEPLMEQASLIIREKACTPLSLAALAELLRLTPVQLTRRYKAAFGLTPSEHVTALRMRQACSLLTGSTRSLDFIAEACGYENAFYFSRIFTKRMGTSPSAYRRAYRI